MRATQESDKKRHVVNGLRLGLAGVMGFVAVSNISTIENAAHCLGDIAACISPHLPNFKPKSTAPTFGKFRKLGETLTSNVAVITFGEGTEIIQGTGHLDYRSSSYLGKASPFPNAVDGTIFLVGKPVETQYRPCLITGDDYQNPTLKISGDAAQSGAFHLQAITAPDGSKSVVASGSIIPCDVHLTTNPKNEQAFKETGKMNNGYRGTFRNEANTLLTDFARANACPTGIVDLEGAAKTIETTARGFMLSSPNAQWREYASMPISVQIDSPVAAQQEAQNQLLTDEATIKAQVHTAVPDSKGHTFKIAPAQFDLDSFTQVNCVRANLNTALQP